MLSMAALILAGTPLRATAATPEVALLSGAFGDERLIVAADPETKTLSGYYRDDDLPPIAAATSVKVTSSYQSHTLRKHCSVLKNGRFVSLGDCANGKADGSFAIKRSARRRLQFRSDGLAAVGIREHGYAYVRRDGYALVVHTFDNGPDDFADGLVRVKIGKKTGYANASLALVIPADYDGALPFDRGRARACIGCTSVSDGEHSWYVGGQDVCLDSAGARRPSEECGAEVFVPPQFRE